MQSPPTSSIIKEFFYTENEKMEHLEIWQPSILIYATLVKAHIFFCNNNHALTKNVKIALTW